MIALVIFVLVGRQLIEAMSPSKAAANSALASRLEQSESLNRLLLQQVDATFELAMQGYSADESLTEQQLKFFTAWQRYDQEYVDRIRQQPASLFVRATAMSRRGRSLMVLDQPKQAVEQFETAATLLTQLATVNPTIPCYTADLVATHTAMARCLQLLHENDRAKEKLMEAEQTIRDSKLPSTDDTNHLLSFLLERVQSQLDELRADEGQSVRSKNEQKTDAVEAVAPNVL